MSAKHILLGHGSGGKLTHELIEELFRPILLPSNMEVLHDSTIFTLQEYRLAITTDSFVVDPIFFPGGDIGTLAVNGTVNDLSVSGARPLVIGASFILEEGFSIEDLKKILLSMKEASRMAGVRIVTGDTKVVNRGKCDRIFITTTGIGVVEYRGIISPRAIRPGDLILVNGSISSHGTAIMLSREDMEYMAPVISDTAPLNDLVSRILNASENIHCMRDLTRGGLAGALKEIALASGYAIRIHEDKIPVQEEVKGVCEILGLDPLHVANEGKLVVFVSEEDCEKVLEIMHSHPLGRDASIIGEVVEGSPGMVTMRTVVGGERIIDMLAGEQLPRIC